MNASGRSLRVGTFDGNEIRRSWCPRWVCCEGRGPVRIRKPVKISSSRVLRIAHRETRGGGATLDRCRTLLVDPSHEGAVGYSTTSIAGRPYPTSHDPWRQWPLSLASSSFEESRFPVCLGAHSTSPLFNRSQRPRAFAAQRKVVHPRRSSSTHWPTLAGNGVNVFLIDLPGTKR